MADTTALYALRFLTVCELYIDEHYAKIAASIHQTGPHRNSGRCSLTAACRVREYVALYLETHQQQKTPNLRRQDTPSLCQQLWPLLTAELIQDVIANCRSRAASCSSCS